ncbi:MAG: hypothetical protein A3H93_07370 [Rhodocyclales bacterium RIFCSPLOWO2_02_FULL_63_24]|nr:MAG: hypothetical protein A3H93_07370 [Rhodocyclales bacterium RIFCSPLOWO2_02_FULL_63_24]
MKSYAKRYPLAGRRWRHADSVRKALAILAAGLTTGAMNAACPPDAADGAVLTKGELVLAYRPLLADKSSRIPMAKHFALEVQLCDPEGVSIARLHKADATMPEHRHGMNYRTLITPLGSGRFRIEGMMFHMAGHWQLAFEIQAGGETTRITHDVQIE